MVMDGLSVSGWYIPGSYTLGIELASKSDGDDNPMWVDVDDICILHIGPVKVAFYWCGKRNENNSGNNSGEGEA